MTGQHAFDKRSAGSGELKCSASEGLSLYPVIRYMLMQRVPDYKTHAVGPAIESFFALCRALDLLQLAICDGTSPDELEAAIKAHLQWRLAVYGPGEFPPKCHYALHLGECWRRHGRLLSCFVHERKHKQIKKFANDSHNANASTSFERGLLLEVVLLQRTQLQKDRPPGMSLVLSSPKPASDAIAAHIRRFLQLPPIVALDVQASLDAWLTPYALCCAHDMVATKDQEVGQVWFHVEANGALYTCWSPCQRGSTPDTVLLCDNPGFIPTSQIERCLVYRVLEDGATVLLVP